MKTVIIGIFLRDGASVSNYFLKLADEFVKLGYHVIIISDRNRKDIVDINNNPMILTWPSYHPKGLKDFLFLNNILKKHKVEMLISNFNATNFFLILGALYGIKHRVVWKHSLSKQFEETPKWKLYRKKWIYKLATQMIANSKDTKSDAIKVFKVAEKKIKILPNLIHENDKYIKLNKEDKIVFVGRFHKSKGIDVLINAFSIVNKEFPHIKLELIGGGDKTEYINLVHKLNIEKKVDFIEEQPMSKVLKHFASAKFSVVPSLSEAFGLIVIESFSVKTPVIGSDTGGISEIIEDGKSGFLVPIGDYKTLAEKMRLLLNDEEMRNKYAEGAHMRFINHYNLEKNIGGVARMFHQDIMDGNIKNKAIG